MNEHKELAMRALSQMRGDDLYRAKAAFKNCTPEQMKEQYGQSGKTRAEIISGYEIFDARIDAALIWLEAKN